MNTLLSRNLYREGQKKNYFKEIENPLNEVIEFEKIVLRSLGF